jgi:hypothetical protein
MNQHEAATAWRRHQALYEEKGISYVPGAEPKMYVPDGWGSNFNMAMDAQSALSTDPNSGVPVWLTMYTDPAVIEVLFAPIKAAEIFGEVRKGTWLDQTANFPVVEHTGETSAYGDYNQNGMSGVNINFPQRQAFLFQLIMQYGELELERAGLARINYVTEKNKAGSGALARFANLVYFFGILGLQNFGLINDPNLSAALTPSTKAEAGYGTKWILNGIPCAANEIYADVEALYYQLVLQSGGLVAQDTKMVLATSPTSAVAFTATNTFNVNVSDLLKKNFPNLRIETAVQYGAVSATNPQGVAAGNAAQLIVDEIEGQDVGYCAFNEKRRSHPIIRHESSFSQKLTAGVWGAVIRMPFGISTMVGL